MTALNLLPAMLRQAGLEPATFRITPKVLLAKNLPALAQTETVLIGLAVERVQIVEPEPQHDRAFIR